MPSRLPTDSSPPQPSNFEAGTPALFSCVSSMHRSIDPFQASLPKDCSFDGATQPSEDKLSSLDATCWPATTRYGPAEPGDRLVGGTYDDKLHKGRVFLHGSVVEREQESEMINSQEKSKGFSSEDSSIRHAGTFEVKAGDQDREDKPTDYQKDASNDWKVVNGAVSGDSSKDRSLTPHRREGSSQVESGSAGEVSSGRKRRSRWEPREIDTETQDSAQSGRKKKSRWAPQEATPLQLPDLFKELAGGSENDPEVQALHLRLLDVNQRLQTGQVLEDRVDGMRSPSPEPIYDNMGIRINTREYRARERLTRERQELIHELIKRNPNFKPPADYRPPKLSKKLYIPVKDYPGYNFIGLIIGPRGNTQKRMQKETGAKIVIRGKGSIKEGRSQQKKDLGVDSGENDDLHVYIEADNENSLQQAVSMVEKLLLPVDELLNEHKKAQLRELAALNGTICENEICRLCGEPGHRHYMCPAKNTTFKSDVSCKICGDGGHPTIDCPMKNSAGPNKMDDEYANFLAEVGGGQQGSGPTGVQTATAGQATHQNNTNGQPTGSPIPGSGPFRPGLGSTGVPHPSKEIDETNLYIGYLPPSIDDQGLINLFSPFGKIEASKLIKDRTTGWSKGYGFVKYSDPAEAAQAVIHMNGYRLDGKVLAVRVAGRPPPPAGIVPPIPFQNHPVGFPPQPQPQQQQPLPPGSTMPVIPVNQPPPWSMPHIPHNPYGPPNNYYGPPPPGAVPPYQQSPYPYPAFMGQQPPPSSGFVGPSIQGPPGNMFPPGTGAPSVAPSVNAIPPPPGIPSNAPPANGVSQDAHQYADYSNVPPPPATDYGTQQVEHNAVESEYERFMSEMQH